MIKPLFKHKAPLCVLIGWSHHTSVCELAFVNINRIKQCFMVWFGRMYPTLLNELYNHIHCILYTQQQKWWSVVRKLRWNSTYGLCWMAVIHAAWIWYNNNRNKNIIINRNVYVCFDTLLIYEKFSTTKNVYNLVRQNISVWYYIRLRQRRVHVNQGPVISNREVL